VKFLIHSRTKLAARGGDLGRTLLIGSVIQIVNRVFGRDIAQLGYIDDDIHGDKTIAKKVRYVSPPRLLRPTLEIGRA